MEEFSTQYLSVRDYVGTQVVPNTPIEKQAITGIVGALFGGLYHG